MSYESRGLVYLGADHCLILRSDAQHRVSKDGPESVARFASGGTLPRQARDRLFEAPSGRLRARGQELLMTRGGSR
jgi:hypothetical protein